MRAKKALSRNAQRTPASVQDFSGKFFWKIFPANFPEFTTVDT
jgi:hypothetical protein